MAFASVTDVQVRLGRPVVDSAEIAQITAWIGDAEALIKTRIPDLAERVLDGRLSPEVVTLVEAQAVERKVRNPGGKQNERIDDYSYGLNPDAARGDLFITDAEWDLLLPTTGFSGAFTIRPFGEPSRGVDLGWLP